MRIDSWISFHLSKLSDTKLSLLYYISLVRGWKEKIYFDHLKGQMKIVRNLVQILILFIPYRDCWLWLPTKDGYSHTEDVHHSTGSQISGTNQFSNLAVINGNCTTTCAFAYSLQTPRKFYMIFLSGPESWEIVYSDWLLPSPVFHDAGCSSGLLTSAL